MRSEDDLVCEMEVKLEFDSDAMTWCFSTFFVREREREKLGSNFLNRLRDGQCIVTVKKKR